MGKNKRVLLLKRRSRRGIDFMHYLSLDTIIYRPEGGGDLVLCQYDDVMAQLVEIKPSVQVQRDAVIGSPWMIQGGRGNSALQMTFTVVRAFVSAGRARGWGLDLQEQLILHPAGTVRWLTSYYQGRAGRERIYYATVDGCRPLPLTSEHDLGAAGPSMGQRADDVLLPGGGRAWVAVEFSLTLTGDVA